MNLRVVGSLPKWLLVFMLASALTLTSSCSTPQAVPQPQFKAMQPPGQWYKPNYTTILGPVTGVGSTVFTISARPGIAAWLGCIGKGLVWLRSPVMTFAAACSDGGVFAGGLNQPTHLKPGQKVTVRVVAPATTRWDLRIDGTHKPAPRVTTTERYTHVATLQMKDASERMSEALWGQG